jgi:hypothetical protein
MCGDPWAWPDDYRTAFERLREVIPPSNLPDAELTRHPKGNGNVEGALAAVAALPDDRPRPPRVRYGYAVRAAIEEGRRA